jgi:transcriptional regulator
MYVPLHNRMSDTQAAHAAMRAHEFAMLVTWAPEGLVATHAPLLLEAGEGPLGTLYGHVAKANPHCAALDGEHMAIFAGPHSYVSPTWYPDPKRRVPTWNYVAVHAYGRGETLNDAQAEALIARMVAYYEPTRDWTLETIPADYKTKLLAAITAFKIVLTRIDAKAKLDQHKTPVERLAAVAALEARGETQLARLMREVGT